MLAVHLCVRVFRCAARLPVRECACVCSCKCIPTSATAAAHLAAAAEAIGRAARRRRAYQLQPIRALWSGGIIVTNSTPQPHVPAPRHAGTVERSLCVCVRVCVHASSNPERQGVPVEEYPARTVPDGVYTCMLWQKLSGLGGGRILSRRGRRRAHTARRTGGPVCRVLTLGHSHILQKATQCEYSWCTHGRQSAAGAYMGE